MLKWALFAVGVTLIGAIGVGLLVWCVVAAGALVGLDKPRDKP